MALVQIALEALNVVLTTWAKRTDEGSKGGSKGGDEEDTNPLLSPQARVDAKEDGIQADLANITPDLGGASAFGF